MSDGTVLRGDLVLTAEADGTAVKKRLPVDVPHLLPTVPDLPTTLTGLTIHSSAPYPSELTIPALD